MSLAKLNCRDVAKDFGMQAKAVTAILTEHTKENVSPTKILTDRELSIIFEHLTQRNQVDSIESIYADVYFRDIACWRTNCEIGRAHV